jgi:cell division transport system permease protein
MSNIHLKTALSSIRRSPFQAFAATFVLTITFFVITTLSVLVYSSSKVLTYFETRPQVIAFLKDEATSQEVSTLQARLQKDTRVKDVKYVSKEEALLIYKESTSDNPLLAELVSPTIFPASLEFSLVNLNFAEEVIKELKNISWVDQVGFTASLGGEENLQDSLKRLKTVTWYVRIGGGVFVGILLFTSLIVLLVVISMRILTRRKEVEILDLIGATKGFIRSPILIEAFLYSTIGVIVGWLLSLVLILYSTPAIISYFKEIPVLPKDTLGLFEVFGLILLAELVIGSILSLVGSMLAVSRAAGKK